MAGGFGEDFFDNVLENASGVIRDFTPQLASYDLGLGRGSDTGPYGNPGGADLWGTVFGGNPDAYGQGDTGYASLLRQVMGTVNQTGGGSGNPATRRAQELQQQQAAAGGSGSYSSASTSDFIRSVLPYAQQVEVQTGIPARVMIAIAANETGYGKAVAGNNFFGIKGNNPRTGANTGAVDTWEVINGQRVNIKDTFRAYDNPAESFADFADFLKTNSRYAGALQQLSNPEAFVRAIHAAGYATDPLWSTKILNIAASIPNGPGSGVRTAAAAPLSVSFGFGQRYDNPIRSDRTGQLVGTHGGVDLIRQDIPNNGRGAAVASYTNGVVELVGSAASAGNYVMVRDSNGLEHWYMHLDGTALKRGQQVTAGSEIGILGGSGTEEFPHLHFEVRDQSGRSLDPMPWVQGQR